MTCRKTNGYRSKVKRVYSLDVLNKGTSGLLIVTSYEYQCENILVVLDSDSFMGIRWRVVFVNKFVVYVLIYKLGHLLCFGKTEKYILILILTKYKLQIHTYSNWNSRYSDMMIIQIHLINLNNNLFCTN